MNIKKYKVLGIMSGTSCDGLDIAYCEYWEKNNKWNYKLLDFTTINYNKKWRKKLLNCYKINAYELKKLDINFGDFISQSIKKFIIKHKIKPDLIASHGHTVFHNPIEKISLQIGNPLPIFSKIKIPIIYNFRELDIIIGGQGAPLVPYGEKHLFSQYDYCINIGGILNLTDLNETNLLAFDVCPANLVLNFLARKLNMKFDKNGETASKGKMINNLYNKLNNLKYYNSSKPKSLDINYIEKKIMPLLEKYEPKDTLHTFTEHIAFQVNKNLNKKNSSVLLTGGGTFNEYLVKRIKINNKVKSIFVVPEKKLINFKEALIFGFLGLMRLLNRKNILKSVTGSQKSTSSGIIINNKIF
ncbi:MAG: anhydro-N-acetylmuramic acid kinase [Bacteroidota bacterium]|nr:anhydro-N-acetylmuramic acid kinase [Bacteroidota bacterium]